MMYLLDTDTIIYWMKGDKNISKEVLDAGFHNIASSDITKAELYYGAYKSQRIDENLTSIKTLIEKINFLPFNDPAQAIFGEKKIFLERQGNRIEDFDLIIASTALAYNLTLITNNIRHFERIHGLQLDNWL